MRTSSLLALAALSCPARAAAAQDTARVSGAVTVTNKGISTIPSFTLGRPAAVLDVSIRKGALAFEPQFRFGLDGKPWAFLFWGRHRLHDGERFDVSVGAHPALAFRTRTVTVDGAPREEIVARRFFAGEVAPTYALSGIARVGAYYLYSRGLDAGATRNTHFVSARANFTTRRIARRYVARLDPQLYYLRADDRDGTYANAGATVTRADLPFALSATVNEPLRTRVPGGDRRLWNVSLAYAIR
jgi:hypothetical protein